MATIHDVARRAGVSVATVSRVLNGKQLVREETSRQVVEAARALRYVPNVAARTLSIRRSQAVGIVLPEVHGEFFSEVIRGADLAARQAGYHILVSGSHSDAAEMIDVVEAMRGRVDGLLVMAPDIALPGVRDRLLSGLPHVLLNVAESGHDSITIDNFGGARTMMRHLAGLGHLRIAFVRGPEHNADSRERLRGYRASMRGLAAAVPLELDGDFTEKSGYEAAVAALEGRPRPTAIFAANDSMAIGAMSALLERGIAVPDEMTVVGFDDIPIAHYVQPALTTIAVDIAELGRRAFALVLEAIEAPHAPRQQRIRTTLVVRRSCGKPHGDDVLKPHAKRRARKKGVES